MWKGWPEDLAIFAGVFVAALISDVLADGTARYVLMIAIAVVIGVLVRLSTVALRRSRDHREA